MIANIHWCHLIILHILKYKTPNYLVTDKICILDACI